MYDVDAHGGVEAMGYPSASPAEERLRDDPTYRQFPGMAQETRDAVELCEHALRTLDPHEIRNAAEALVRDAAGLRAELYSFAAKCEQVRS